LRGGFAAERTALEGSGALPLPAGLIRAPGLSPWEAGHVIAGSLGGQPVRTNSFWGTYELNSLMGSEERTLGIMRRTPGACIIYEVHLDYAALTAAYPSRVVLAWRDHPNATAHFPPGLVGLPNYPPITMGGRITRSL